jgi:hypothetical protein
LEYKVHEGGGSGHAALLPAGFKLELWYMSLLTQAVAFCLREAIFRVVWAVFSQTLDYLGQT